MVLLIVAYFTWQRKSQLFWLYAIWLIATAAWGVWESGFYFWALATRLGLWLVIGLLMLLIKSDYLQVNHSEKRYFSRAKTFLGASTLVLIIALFATLLHDPNKIEGSLTRNVSIANPDLGESFPVGDWQDYGHTVFGQRYSPLEQITADNITNLKKAWQYQTGDVKQSGDTGELTYEATPIKIENTLYLCTPHNWLVALDTDTGAERWVYKAGINPNNKRQHQTCRGVSYYSLDGQKPSEAALCRTRIYLPTSDARLLAVDPVKGKLCEDFGENGEIDLLKHMPFKQDGYYYSTSPVVVANGIIVIGGAVNDNYNVNSPSGVVRGFDAETGQLLWNWDSAHPERTAPLTGDETYATSSPNAWAPLSADPELGLVYLPMGNRTPDQLGWYRNEAEEKILLRSLR